MIDIFNITTIKKIFRYIVSGGTGAVTDIFFLYLFVEWLHIWYIVSAIIAFVIAFFVSFTLQKFWTFGDKETTGIGRQATKYFIVSAVNLCLNTLLMYALVDLVGTHYILSQIITGGLLAVSSFFIYSRFIFSKKSPEQIAFFEDTDDLK